MAAKDFTLIPFPNAVYALNLKGHFGDRMFNQYYESADDEIARIEASPHLKAKFEARDAAWREGVRRQRPMRFVRYYSGDGVIAGDIDLDALFYQDNVAGFIVDGDLRIDGSLMNWEIDTTASFVAARGDLVCKNIIAGCADIVVRSDARVSNAIVSTYNHGRLEIGGDAYAKYFIVDDHWTYVGRDVHGYGWQCAGHGDVDLPDSDWIEEIRPQFSSEFFREDGHKKCPSGNVDLVKALLAGRAILNN